jgi:hypothetical protein
MREGGLIAYVAAEEFEDVGGLGTDAEVGVCFGEDDGVCLVDDEDSRERETPAGFCSVVIAEARIVEGDVDEDGLVIAAQLMRNGVGDAELFGHGGAGVGEEGKGKAVLLEGEIVLACGLGGDGYKESTKFAEFGVQIAPSFQLGDAVGIPAAAEEAKDEGAEGEKVGGADEFASAGIFEGEGRSLRSDLQDAVFDAGVEEFFGRFFGDDEALGLNEGTGVLGDAIELVLERDF